VSGEPLVLSARVARPALSERAREAAEKLPSMVTALPAVPGLVITDDDNPLESMQLRKGEAYRRVLREHFGRALLAQ
jgi:hypothetical protein